jgi:hypothetical protein
VEDVPKHCKVREFSVAEVRKLKAQAPDAPKIEQKWCLKGPKADDKDVKDVEGNVSVWGLR